MKLLLLVSTPAVFGAPKAFSQAFPIGIIDFYGVSTVSVERARAALTFAEGDTISFAGDEPPAFVAESEARLATVPGVKKAIVNIVCCDNGRAIVYVGIQETGAEALPFRPAPSGNEALAADIVAAGNEFDAAFTKAVESGDFVEDRSQGHALNHDPATRAIQERFVVYAKRDLPALRRVLRNSANPAERALAAQVLGYAPDKSAVVDDLVYGMSDPAEAVRNNSMRALLVIAEMTERKPPSIPAAPFIALLNSPVWTDRNKASLALQSLTAKRDPKLLSTLRTQALDPLVEIARWKSEGHAMPAFQVLARIANYSDEAAHDLWTRGQGETVIQAAVSGKPPAVLEVASVLGTWTGTSTCVGNRPACKDEIVVYRVMPGDGHPHQVRMFGDKIIEGKRLPMGMLVFDVDAANRTLRCEFRIAQTHGVWSFNVTEDTMIGKLLILPEESVARNVTVRRTNEKDMPPAPPLSDYAE